MIERMLFALLLLAAGAVLYATHNLTVVTRDLLPQISVVIEAVAMIEESADAVAADTAILRCAERQGEWHDEFGCVLEIIE